MLKAKGIKNGKKLTVVYHNKEFAYSTGDNPIYDLVLKGELSMRHVFGGTYYPDDDYDILNVINVLANYFFDEPTNDISGDEYTTLLNEEGCVY